jgi:diguanylate cyclase (GGDEF)-like protein
MPTKSKRVLVVLEDPTLDKILTYLLKAWGYDVTVSDDAAQTLALAVQKHPDLILIDAHLERTDGLKLCKTLKHDFITAYIPIILLIEKKQLRRNLLDVEQGVDDFLIKPPDPIDLEIRIALALRSADHQFHANALTKLPGNRSIEKCVRDRMEANDPFAFAYCDINNFKAFNDKHGYIAGDRAILQTAKILTASVKKCGNKNDFVGHIGGDDFVFVTTPDKAAGIAQACLAEFDRLMPLHYASEEREGGYVHVADRRGVMSKIPLMGLSVAIVNFPAVTVHSIYELIEIAFEIKTHIKKHPQSNYLINRRVSDAGIVGRRPLATEYEKDLKIHPHAKTVYKPLGQVMLATRLVNDEQLNDILSYHWQTGSRVGEAAIALGFATARDIDRLLEHQPTFTRSQS